MNDPDDVLRHLDSVPIGSEDDYWASLPERTSDDDGWGEPPRFSTSEPETQEATVTGGAVIETFAMADLAAWSQQTPEPKSFLMAGVVPEGEVTLFTGKGGTNKSTFGLQLCAASAAGRPMLGTSVQPGNALYVTAEDDDRENHWRLLAIARTIGTTLDALAGKLSVVSLRGRLNNELATFDGEGRLHPAPAFELLRGTIKATRAKFVVLDNVGHLYVGNENDRGQVTGFINLLYQLCREQGVTIVLIGHPNKAGDSYSGSTAWLNAVRSQITLQRPEGNPDPDTRLLTLGKANYARPDQQLAFRWHDFALILDSDLADDRRAEIAAVVMAGADNDVFLSCLRIRNGQERPVSENAAAARTYAPRVFAEMPEAKGATVTRMEAAMERLFRLGRIERGVVCHTGRKDREGLIECADVRADAALTPCADVRHLLRADRADTHPPLRGDAGAAFQGLAPAPSDTDQQPDQRMILAPGETGDDDPIPGWDE